MKWEKYIQVLATNPDVAAAIIEVVGPPNLHASPVDAEKLRRWVEMRLKYITFRRRGFDFDVASDFVCERDVTRSEEFFLLFFHVGEERQCFRMRALSSGPHETLTELVQHLVDWHVNAWAGELAKNPLVLDVVICSLHEGNHRPTQALLCYKIPGDFQLPPPSVNREAV